jgi:hypothetical protein
MDLHKLGKSIYCTLLLGIVVNLRHDHLEALTDDVTAGSDYLPLGALAIEFEKVKPGGHFIQPQTERHNFDSGSVGILHGF